MTDKAAVSGPDLGDVIVVLFALAGAAFLGCLYGQGLKAHEQRTARLESRIWDLERAQHEQKHAASEAG